MHASLGVCVTNYVTLKRKCGFVIPQVFKNHRIMPTWQTPCHYQTLKQ